MDRDPHPVDPNSLPQTYGTLVNLGTSGVRDCHSELSGKIPMIQHRLDLSPLSVPSLIPCCSNLASCSIFGNTSGGTAPNSPAPSDPAGRIAAGCATPQSEPYRMDTPTARTSTTTFMEHFHRLSHARRLATNAGNTSAGTPDRARH